MTELNVKPRTIFCRDNLDILRGINSDCIDLIYLDPPFNKKKVFTAPIGSSAEGAAFSDIFREEDFKDEWVESIEYENPELHSYLSGVRSFSNKYNYCYLVYMAIRLIECHRILKDTGSIYLHCDPTMSHYLKIVMDCIFGEGNFRNEIIWAYRKWTNSSTYFQRNHDIILFYIKEKNYTFNKIYSSPTDSQSAVIKRGWNVNKVDKGLQLLIYNQEKYEKALHEGKIDMSKYSTIVNKSDSLGTAISDYWEIQYLHSQAKERTGYPTQKPLALLERIIKASSNKGDIVLDPFCGCATTCVAAEQLGRKWIGIDISHKAYELVNTRLEKMYEEISDHSATTPLLSGYIEAEYTTTPPILGERQEQGGYVYIISNAKWKGIYKVGVAKDPKRRLNNYQTSDPDRGYQLEYSHKTPYFREIEKKVHNKFKRYHEWVEAADVQEIKDAIKNIDNELHN